MARMVLSVVEYSVDELPPDGFEHKSYAVEAESIEICREIMLQRRRAQSSRQRIRQMEASESLNHGTFLGTVY